jgi:hypothetical protein
MAARRVGSVPWRGDVFCGVGGTARGLVVAPLRRTHERSGWVAPSARGRTGRVPALGHACGGHVGPVWPYLCRYQHRSHKCEQLAKMFDVSGEPQIRNASNRQKRTCRDIFGEMHGKESTRLLEPRATERGRGPSVQQGMFVSECLNSALICCVRVVSCLP